LTHLTDAQDAVDVTRPAVGMQTRRNGRRLPTPLRNARVQLGGNLADGAAINPAVFPELAGVPITDHHLRRGEEEVLLLLRGL
jgi:hypothetical protein